MTCALKKFLEKFPDGDLRKLGCIFHLYDEHEVREFTSISLWSAMYFLCNCSVVFQTVQRFLKRMRDNNIMNMKGRMGKWFVYELNMQNELVADLFSKYQALKRGEVYVNGDGKSLICKHELLFLRQYWCSDERVSDVRLVKVMVKIKEAMERDDEWKVKRLLENLEKGV